MKRETTEHEDDGGAGEKAEDHESNSQSESDNEDETEHGDTAPIKNGNEEHGTNGSAQKSAAAAKRDPNRPKRKKARRACFACQRAHLTCGDERPCARCIKRGLAGQCQDGMRKKAKYLHDAPNELLMPTYGGTYGQKTTMAAGANGNGSMQDSHMGVPPVQPVMQPGQYTQQQSALPPYQQQHTTTPVGSNQLRSILSDNSNVPGLGSQASPQSQNFGSPLNTVPPQSMGPPPTPSEHSFGNPLFDLSDPTQYNFDLASMNFGNQYGAMEFGMLNHMAMGTNDNPLGGAGSLVTNGFDGQPMGALDFINSPETYHMHRHSSAATDWSNPHNGLSRYPSNHGAPNAYVIGNANSHASPDSSGPDHAHAFNSPPYRRGSVGALSSIASPDRHLHGDETGMPPPATQTTVSRRRRGSPEYDPDISKSIKQGSAVLKTIKRRRDPSWIYEKVKTPYPYTAMFHSLTKYLQTRFTGPTRLRIARAMASIRPSLISLQRNLIEQDLVLMEQCFQRQLLEIENIAESCGTPTIAIRRSGEVAYVGNEFVALTGWSRDVLLGRAPNLNVNQLPPVEPTPLSSGGNSHVSTPAIPARVEGETGPQPGKPQPVFFSELLDDISAIQFFEDFAKIAFADSKGVAECRCTLLKYRTKDARIDAAALAARDDTAAVDKGEKSAKAGGRKRKPSVVGAEKMGDKEGKVECMYCWQVKRDVFDIPMMIVMNFLPIIT